MHSGFPTSKLQCVYEKGTVEETARANGGRFTHTSLETVLDNRSERIQEEMKSKIYAPLCADGGKVVNEVDC